MDHVNSPELKRVVEQAVRPVGATMARKRRMREELLAHLVAIFEEEAEKLGDEQAALQRAKQRFGDPRELAGQFRRVVPAWDRCRAILENLGCQPGESAWHLAAKHFLAMLLIYAIWLPTWLLIFRDLSIEGPPEAQRLMVLVAAGLVPVMALLNLVLSVILAPLVNKIGPVLASKRWGRTVLTVLCGLAALCVLIPHLTGTAILFVLMTRQSVKQWRYQESWA